MSEFVQRATEEIFGWNAIAAVLVSLAGLHADSDSSEPIAAYQPEGSNVFVSPVTQSRIVFRVVSSTELGTDRRYSNEAEETNISWTRVRVQILCESDRNLEGLNAQEYLENLRLRLRRWTALEALDRVKASLLTVGDILPSSGGADGRELDVRAFDVDLSCVLSDTDRSTLGRWVRSIGLAGGVVSDSGETRPFGETQETPVEIT